VAPGDAEDGTDDGPSLAADGHRQHGGQRPGGEQQRPHVVQVEEGWGAGWPAAVGFEGAAGAGAVGALAEPADRVDAQDGQAAVGRPQRAPVPGDCDDVALDRALADADLREPVLVTGAAKALAEAGHRTILSDRRMRS
jgi:hypothetical protein